MRTLEILVRDIEIFEVVLYVWYQLAVVSDNKDDDSNTDLSLDVAGHFDDSILDFGVKEVVDFKAVAAL